MRLNGAVLPNPVGVCIKAEMHMNVIGQAEERCNQAAVRMCGGACVTEG